MFNIDFDATKDVERPESIINYAIPQDVMRALMYLVVGNHKDKILDDGNVRGVIIKNLLSPLGFIEIASGTNRIAFMKNGYIFKIALDIRGIVDNITEYKRSIELPNFVAKTYETNGLIVFQEYVTLMDPDEFMLNEQVVKGMLYDLSQEYLFDDMGVSLKNSANYGYINTPNGREIRILDYGYLYPLKFENRRKLFTCDRCGGLIRWTNNYTGFKCTNAKCALKIRPSHVVHKMERKFDDLDLSSIANEAKDRVNNDN